MIIIMDENTGLFFEINPGNTQQQTLHKRSEELRKIIDDKNATPQRQELARNELISYQEELQNLNELLNLPFDVFWLIEKEEGDEK